MGVKSLLMLGDIDGASRTRVVTLIGSILGALAAGTNYAYSAYAPQMGAKLSLSHTQLNIIGLAGNFGMYGTAPFFGGIADRRGPRVLFILAAVLLLVGYIGIKLFYDEVFGLPGTTEATLTFGLIVMVIFGFCTGAGGSSGIMAGLNATAKSFPDKTRASVTGLVISGFGLSAFVFSTLAHTMFPGDTSNFLLVLALGTSVPMMIGALIVKIVPHNGTGGAYVAINTEDLGDETPFSTIQQRLSSEPVVESSRNHRSRGMLSSDLVEGENPRSRSSSFDLPIPEFGAGAPLPDNGTRHKMVNLGDIGETIESSDIETPRNAQSSSKELGPPNIYGRVLLMTPSFWLLFAIMSLLAGTGLMWINNVGSIIQALVVKGRPKDWDREQSAKLQATHVSIISIMSCLGRVAIGLTADFFHHHFSVRRVAWLIPIALLFILSQVLALNISSPHTPLKLTSMILGFAYGALFSLTPTITSEWFGLPHFSQNWGFVAVAPIVGAYFFNLGFGMNFDAHASLDDTSPISRLRGIVMRAGVSREQLCFEGPLCYSASLKMTIMACMVAVLLCIYALFRDRQMRPQIDTGDSAPLTP